jgi:putative oxidoreductase
MKKYFYNGLSILFGLLLINGGLDKFFHYMPLPEDLPAEMLHLMSALKEVNWLMPLVGAAELIGGLMILLPKTRALGALIIVPVMVGVLLTNIFVVPSGLPIALVIWAILLWIIWENRNQYLPIVRNSK